MAGELGSSTPRDIKAYAATLHGITTLHFYRYEDGVQTTVRNAIKAL